MGTPLQIRDMPEDVLDLLRQRAARRNLSLAAFAREVLAREASRKTMDEVLAGPRLLRGRRLTASQIKRLIRAGRH